MTPDEERSAFFAAFGPGIGFLEQRRGPLVPDFFGLRLTSRPPCCGCLRTKLHITDAAIKVALEGEPELAEWKRLRDDVREKSGKRNELAHHEVLFAPLNPLRETKGNIPRKDLGSRS